MAIPLINRSHVEAAIEKLLRDGIPKHSESTKYDLVMPDGRGLPPKAVLSAAVEIATGRPLPRQDFSGGDETNRRLGELGFEIRLKEGIAVPSNTENDLKPGAIFSNDEIVQLFHVGNSGGMRWSSEKNCLVLVFDHTKSLYDDRWEDGVLYYTGMGTTGDQVLTGQNKRLAEQPQSAVDVHLFEVFTEGRYTYVGKVGLSAAVKEEEQSDETGATRKVYVYPLKLITGSPPEPRTDEILKIREKRQRSLRGKTLAELRNLAIAGGRSKPGRRDARTAQFDRDEAVVEYAKKAAAGICDLCRKPAPFSTKLGPYLECHHVQPLAVGGPDIIENAVALCPNCHRRMHVLDLTDDRAALQARIEAREHPDSGRAAANG
jgi:5-methylcytosine-specific restriction protein A